MYVCMYVPLNAALGIALYSLVQKKGLDGRDNIFSSRSIRSSECRASANRRLKCVIIFLFIRHVFCRP